MVKKVYIVYADIRLWIRQGTAMKSYRSVEDVRWQVVKAMLDDFPALKKRVKDYVGQPDA